AWCFRIGTAELWMVGSAVVALAVVFPYQLPVAFLDNRAFKGNLGLLDIVWHEIGLDQCTEAVEVRCFVSEANIDVASNALAMNLLQTIFRRLEVRADLTREEKATVKFIGPLVIRADELCCGAFF